MYYAVEEEEELHLTILLKLSEKYTCYNIPFCRYCVVQRHLSDLNHHNNMPSRRAQSHELKEEHI